MLGTLCFCAEMTFPDDLVGSGLILQVTVVFPAGCLAQRSPLGRGRSSDRKPESGNLGPLHLSGLQFCEFGLQGICENVRASYSIELVFLLSWDFSMTFGLSISRGAFSFKPRNAQSEIITQPGVKMIWEGAWGITGGIGVQGCLPWVCTMNLFHPVLFQETLSPSHVFHHHKCFPEHPAASLLKCPQSAFRLQPGPHWMRMNFHVMGAYRIHISHSPTPVSSHLTGSLLRHRPNSFRLGTKYFL